MERCHGKSPAEGSTKKNRMKLIAFAPLWRILATAWKEEEFFLLWMRRVPLKWSGDASILYDATRCDEGLKIGYFLSWRQTRQGEYATNQMD
jgi:hypothetical protein